MKIYLTRHGETDWNLAQKIQGSTDTPLNQTGIKQARLLAERLLRDNIHPDIIYTSPLKRASATAQILADALAQSADASPADAPSVKVIPHAGLSELNFGSWEGLTWDQVKEQYQEDYQIWHKDRRYQRPTNGESYQELLERIIPAMQEIVETEGGMNADREVLIVVHSAIIISLRAWMDDTPFHQMAKRYRMGNAEAFVFDAAGLFTQSLTPHGE